MEWSCEYCIQKAECQKTEDERVELEEPCENCKAILFKPEIWNELNTELFNEDIGEIKDKFNQMLNFLNDISEVPPDIAPFDELDYDEDDIRIAFDDPEEESNNIEDIDSKQLLTLDPDHKEDSEK